VLHVCHVQVRLLATNLTMEDVLPVKDKLADALFAGAA
jgi:RNA-splicing ligase RtcB